MASVTTVRERVRACGGRAGLSTVMTEGLATAASELAHNQLRHAHGGRMAVRPTRRLQVEGVEVLAADRGPGLLDPGAALGGGAGPGPGLGAGLAGARRLTHELDLDTRLGEGTCLRVRSFASTVPRSEFAVVGRPLPGERTSGDDAIVIRSPDAILVAVADGLGHGTEAREASSRALGAIEAASGSTTTLGELLTHAAAVLDGTRGIVLALARLDLTTRVVHQVGVGDVRVALLGPAGTVLLPSVPGFLTGRPGERIRIREGSAPFGPHGALVLSTDGLRSGAIPRPGPLPDAARLASQLVTDFSRPTDDVLVFAMRS